MHHVNVSKVKNTKIQINEDGKEDQKNIVIFKLTYSKSKEDLPEFSEIFFIVSKPVHFVFFSIEAVSGR
jgi:hypothetical protein